MEVNIYSVKAKSQAGNIWVKYIMTTQKDQSQKKISQGFWEPHLWNLHILLEIQQRALGPGKSTAGAKYPSLRIHPKSCHIFPLKFATTLLSGSGKGAVGA